MNLKSKSNSLSDFVFFDMPNSFFLFQDVYLRSNSLKIQSMNTYNDRSKATVSTRVSKGRGVPGQTGTGRPVVPLSRDKKFLPVPLSLCPGTRAGAKIPGQNESKNFQKKDQISCFRTSFFCFRTSFPVLEHPFLF